MLKLNEDVFNTVQHTNAVKHNNNNSSNVIWVKESRYLFLLWCYEKRRVAAKFMVFMSSPFKKVLYARLNQSSNREEFASLYHGNGIYHDWVIVL